MKGIILAGGSGSRLNPLTEVTNKHLLAVYDRPMIFYPLQTLLDAGITEIMIITSGGHAGAFLRLLGSGEKYDAKFTFKIQDGSLGIAHAVSLCEEFAAGDDVSVVLGDNVFDGNFHEDVQSFEKGAKIFIKEVTDPERFGVAEVVDGKVVGIEEKPANPKSNFAQTGLYVYDNRVFDIIRELKYSDRGELEITDVNNKYIELGELYPVFIDGNWTDSGTFESLYRANTIARNMANKDDRTHGSIKEEKKDVLSQVRGPEAS